jgi:AcrR family transcriptional regulator
VYYIFFMSNRSSFAQLPLRQRKFAQTKLALLEAALQALESRPLDAITVKELCEAVTISEASFFNYFPRKTDLLVYYVQLWSLEMAWHSERLASRRGGLAAIEEIFALTGRRIAKQPGIMAEIIAEQARMTAPPEFVAISHAERLLVFPELEGIEGIDAIGLEALFPPLLEQAVEAGELPRQTDLTTAMRGLASIFFGLPVVYRRSDPDEVESAYLTQLRIFCAGLRARPSTEAP